MTPARRPLEGVTIQRGHIALTLLPELGGSVGSLTFHGVDVLRRFGGEPSPLNAAGFPMVPFSGRIANGRFVFAGEMISLSANFPPEPHAIHGQGWQSVWAVTARSRNGVRLTFEHEGGNWPWPYRAEQAFELTETGVTLTLGLTNLSERPMPAGIGWHPYFPARGAHIRACLAAIWRSGADMIPASPSPIGALEDLSTIRPVVDLRLDNAFDVARREPENGRIEIVWPEKSLALALEADRVFGKRVVYTPPGADFFCVEPASHSPDALNSALADASTGRRTLEKGETLSGSIRLTITHQPCGRQSGPEST
jgi:aldose 1-epimerase